MKMMREHIKVNKNIMLAAESSLTSLVSEKFNPSSAAPVAPLEQDKGGASGRKEPTTQLFFEDAHREERPSVEKQKSNRETVQGNPKYLLMLSPLLAGYALNNRKWLLFSIDDVRPLHWNDEAIDHLVLHDEYKDILLTLVNNHKIIKSQNHDVIPGKGEGVVVLLSGPPETGKTLTAEAVAESVRRPLYHLQAEDLGSTTHSVRYELDNVLDLATEWNAIVLLNECDALFASRSNASTSRNGVTSVVLDRLEYYCGTIFLTTNLLEHINDAFRSRAQIHLCYPELSVANRRQLWERFIVRLRKAPIRFPSNDFASSESEAFGGAIEIELLIEDYSELSE
ncbi:hypothetical protein EPUS_05761 [Endocarpon pusillum Z07020]|uniref:AAA+ ATPase domain-containing protein n=1 Tax=Endocarpon pusillum (strain Z07020 / HMAS-L-300199) TaxID=1263415 RepID=U1HF58_ENDPU|nr:uncharacterized protein EPUS_05761 [Endocarpon pusillum Z07020]ERF68700.1 hypothetical protein EPUS_05761 [Endocarpon pusillum Z07020]